MSRKYDALFFANGRVAFIEQEDINKAIEAGKEILVVCNAWSGGYTKIIGANKEYNYLHDFDDNEPEYCYMMYGGEVKDEVFTPEQIAERFYKIIFTSGEMIYMETGDQASYYSDGLFIDWNSKDYRVSEHIRIDKNLPFGTVISDDEILAARKKVNSHYTVNHLGSKDKGEKVQTLIAYGVIDRDSKKYL